MPKKESVSLDSPASSIPNKTDPPAGWRFSMETTQARVKTAVDGMIEDLDKNYLRDLQKNMFICSSKCCDNKTGSRESVEACVDKCNGGMKNAQRLLEKELSLLQDQLSRCAMTCYDKLIQQNGPDISKYSDNQRAVFDKKLDECVAKCADDHIRIIPNIKERFARSL